MANCPNCHGYGVVTYYHGQQARIDTCRCGTQKRIPPPFFWTREYEPYPEALIKRRIALQDAEAKARQAVIEKYRSWEPCVTCVKKGQLNPDLCPGIRRRKAKHV